MSHTCAIAETPEHIDGLLKTNACVIYDQGNDSVRVYVKSAYLLTIVSKFIEEFDYKIVLETQLLTVVEVYRLEPEMIKQYVLMLLNPDEYM